MPRRIFRGLAFCRWIYHDDGMSDAGPRTEFELIAWLQRQAPVAAPVAVGIGDDAAVLAPVSKPQIVTTDLLTEGVDFLWPQASAREIGYKALAVNLSDVAAMAARPTAAFVSLAAPRDRGPDWVTDILLGVLDLARLWNVTLAGGDTNTWDGGLVLSVTVLGEPVGQQPVLRNGAQPGDWILATGAFGGSLPSGRHLRPEPRLQEAARLVELANVHSLIDVSDGLAADLHHILEASRVGAELSAAAIPIHPDAAALQDGISPLDHALGDGEDFELLCTLSPTDAERVLTEWNLATPLTRLGTITTGSGCRLIQPDGRAEELTPRGWRHAWTTTP